MSCKRKIKYVHSDYLLAEADKNPAVKGRASLTHELIKSYDLLKHMELLTPKACNTSDLCVFHSRDYVQQLQNYHNKKSDSAIAQSSHNSSASSCEEDLDVDVVERNEQYGLSYDCTPWRGLREYACCIAGATMTACETLCRLRNEPQVIINWTGGWHHAHRTKASGFCYVNDIVLGIMVLRTSFQRVLYIDLDVHHGDAVERAFVASTHVFTLSFHQHEVGYYPGTGAATDCGISKAKGYTANFPYASGITGDTFCKYFKNISEQILECFNPDVCMMQCGADVLIGDPLGGTNLTPTDILTCLRSILRHNDLPVILLGGGGYNFPNASRLWTLLTAEVCNQSIDDDIPSENANFLDYGPDYSMSVERNKILIDRNKEEDLEATAKCIESNLLQSKMTVNENLKNIEPKVQTNCVK